MYMPEILYCKNNPCKNDGVCRETNTTYECQCCPAFTGQNCALAASKTFKDVEICDAKREHCYYTRGEVLYLSLCMYFYLYFSNR